MGHWRLARSWERESLYDLCWERPYITAGLVHYLGTYLALVRRESRPGSVGLDLYSLLGRDERDPEGVL